MNDWVTLYTGNDASAESLSSYLAERSIEAYKSAKRGPIESKAARRSRRVRVQVPPDQAETAKLLLEEWRLPHEARAREASRRGLKVLGLSLLAPAAWVSAHFAGVADVPFPQPVLVFFVWMALLVVIAQIENRRHRSERIGRTG